MALGDPVQLLIIIFVALAIPAIVVYWIVRLAISHEQKRKPAGPGATFSISF
ncbi:MAG TPA: hypothetical protein VE955_04510 [Candidatus Dormibacteraeota bacterium]|nr:hypothetical protein [Candidatus Dormibacteraeota bacterium]